MKKLAHNTIAPKYINRMKTCFDEPLNRTHGNKFEERMIKHLGIRGITPKETNKEGFYKQWGNQAGRDIPAEVTKANEHLPKWMQGLCVEFKSLEFGNNINLSSLAVQVEKFSKKPFVLIVGQYVWGKWLQIDILLIDGRKTFGSLTFEKVKAFEKTHLVGFEKEVARENWNANGDTLRNYLSHNSFVKISHRIQDQKSEVRIARLYMSWKQLRELISLKCSPSRL